MSIWSVSTYSVEKSIYLETLYYNITLLRIGPVLSDYESEEKESIFVFAHTIVHSNICCVAGWSSLRLAAVAEEEGSETQ